MGRGKTAPQLVQGDCRRGTPSQIGEPAPLGKKQMKHPEGNLAGSAWDLNKLALFLGGS